MTKIIQNNFYAIESSFSANEDLKLEDKAVLAYMLNQYRALRGTGREFYQSYQFMANRLGDKRRTIERIVNKLIDLGYIKVFSRVGTSGIYSVYTSPSEVEEEIESKVIVEEVEVASINQEPEEVITSANKNLTIEEIMTSERCLWDISQGEIRRVNYLTGVSVGDALELYNNNETTTELDDLLLFKFLVSAGVGDSIDDNARKETQEQTIPI